MKEKEALECLALRPTVTWHFYNNAAQLKSLLTFTFLPFFFKKAERKGEGKSTSKNARERRGREKAG